jgi:hypothetical protein
MPNQFQTLGFEIRATRGWLVAFQQALADAKASGAPAPVIRPACPRPGSAPPPGGEHHEDHQAERDAHRDEVKSQPGLVRGLVHGHQDGADRHRYGGRHRQHDDEPYPPGRGGSRAHCSTIASPLEIRRIRFAESGLRKTKD